MSDNDAAPGSDDIRIDAAAYDAIGDIADFNVAMALETESLELDRERVFEGAKAVVDNPRLGFYLIARIAELPVGCLMVTNEWSDWRNGMFWWIQSVYVTPAYRGRGVYRRLYHDVVRRALEDGSVCGIRLYVERDNRIAQNVYQALGMHNSGYLVFESHLPPD